VNTSRDGLFLGEKHVFFKTRFLDALRSFDAWRPASGLLLPAGGRH